MKCKLKPIRIILTFTYLFLMGFMIILICGCINQRVVNKIPFEKSVSEGLSHSELVQYYAKLKSISEKEAEAKIAIMNLTGLESDFEQYRMVSLPVEKDNNCYIIWFICIADKKNDDWRIKSIESAWIENQNDESQIFLGSINFWIRGERKLECAANGDLYNIADAEVEFQKSDEGKAQTINIIPIGRHMLKSLEYLELHQILKI